MAEPLGAVKAHGLQAPVSQHFQHLSVFCKDRTGVLNSPANPENIILKEHDGRRSKTVADQSERFKVENKVIHLF